MTTIQQLLWKLDVDYLGHPYYVSGNAIAHALGQHLPYETAQSLHVSHGIFVPGQFGTFPAEHSEQGAQPGFGSGLKPVTAYDDLFLYRHPQQTWLLDSRPRDALNTHDIRIQSGHPALAHETIRDMPEEHRQDRRVTSWFVTAYVHADDQSVLPLEDSALSGLQFGGKRNYGYGLTQLQDTQMVDIDELDYSRLTEADAFEIELITPFVLESEFPNTTAQRVPWWWQANRTVLRERTECLVLQQEAYSLQTVDHGQVSTYKGECPVETAKNGICRIGTHSKYGFGEFRLKPINTNLTRNT